jgi:uracil-DNA glycosylase family 4
MDDLAALRLMIEWGADEALEDAPIDRTRAIEAPAPILKAAPQPAPMRIGPVSRAQAVADGANTIEALRAALDKFAECPLATTATNLVFADGTADAGLVLIGEAPGAEEDVAGRPFVGASGKLLDRMFASAGLARETNMLITNLIPWRPPGNRPPTDTEVNTCLPFLLRHLTLLRPKVIVTLGALSTRALTGRDDGIRRLRGRWQNVSIPGLPAPIPTLPMLHPAYLLRMPGAKKEAWTDILALRRKLDQT